jgi:integrase
MPRPSKPWYCPAKSGWFIEPGGKRIRLTTGPKKETRKEAFQKFHEYMSRPPEEREPEVVHAPVESGPQSLTVARLIDEYLEIEGPKLGERTRYERKRLLQKFVDDHGNKRVADCLPFHLESWLRSHAEWKSRDTIAEAVKVVKRVFNWGEDMGIAPPSPFRRRVSYTFGNSRRPMTEEEFRKLIAACTPRQQRLRQMLLFSYEVGARPVEARTARWTDLDAEQGTITLRQHKTSKTRNDSAPRVLYLTDEVIRLLIDLRRREPDTEFIFPNRCRRPYHRNSVQQNLRRLRRKIGLPEDVKLYGTRHSFGTRAVLNGVNLATLAELMGHTKGSRITASYIHLAGQHGHLKDALRRINRPSAPECA